MMKNFNLKTLAVSLSTIITATAVTQANASDIEIYQPPSKGATSLVFMLDISGSMDVGSANDDYRNDDGGEVAWERETVTLANGRQATRARSYQENGFSGYTRDYYFVSNTNARQSKSVRDNCIAGNNGYKCYSRMARLQDAFYLLLNGGTDLKGNKIEKISDDKVIGLSTLGVFVNNTRYDTGRMVVPSRRLDEMVGGKAHRQILTEEMSNLTAKTNTPTARSFAEVVAYFMGKNTNSAPSQYKTSATQYLYIPSLNRRFRCDHQFPTRCNATQSGQQRVIHARDILGTGTESGENRLLWTNWPINIQDESNNYTMMSGYVYVKDPDKVVGVSGFAHSDSSTKNGTNYASPLDSNSCSAQGVYVLTDGEPTQDSGSEGLFASAFGESIDCPKTGDSFFCAIEASKKLLSGNHAKKVPIKTAVVGFGDVFTKIPSYDATLTEAENLAKVGVVNGDIVKSLASGTNIEQRRAAAWGIVGGGGWYSGASTVSVVESVNNFLKTLTTDIPTMTTGSPTIPVSALNRQTLLSDAYYASFAPQPTGEQRLWTGNMNKYSTLNGTLYGKGNSRLFQTDGLLNAETLGLWDVEGNGDVARGVQGNLKLRTDAQNRTQRKIYTEGASDTRALTLVTVDSLRSGEHRNSTAKNHWLNLLGYNVSETEQVDFNQLNSKAELRQLGATMHSSPLLLTQSGRIDRSLTETNRDDYIVYGSTQGVLHIVDAATGEERFAFVPQKMVDTQKEAFLHEKSTKGGKDRLFYGIDGTWVAHTEYVVRSSSGADNGTLTVGLSNTSDTNSPRGRQWIYGGLRMGGKNFYGLDLSSVANTTKECVQDDVGDKDGAKYNACRRRGQLVGAPVLKFNIDPDAQAVFSPAGRKNYPELATMGQSWSKPALGYVRWNGQRRLVMFVGGGYDVGYENSTYDQTNGVGAGVYMFDANTGDLLWWASNNTVTGSGTGVVKHSVTGDDANSLKYSVVSRINAIDRDSDGLVDALYFGDLGGQGFRIDLDNFATLPNSNTRSMRSLRVVKIFDEHKTDGTSPRFYEMPSISVHEATDGARFSVVAFGSGDRSSPLAGERTDPATRQPITTNANTATDATVVVYDYDLGKTTWRNLTINDLQTRHTKGALRPAELNSTHKNTAREVKADYVNQGWKYTFPATKKGQFKTFGEPYAVTNLLFVNTYDRDGGGLTGECGGGVVGVSRAYQFCLPTGICDTTNHGYNRNDTTPVASSATPGLVEMTLGLNGQGIGNLGNVSTKGKNDSSGTTTTTPAVAGSVDCRAHPEAPECLNVEMPSTISQLRWFESRTDASK